MHSALRPSAGIADHGPDRPARMGGAYLLLTAAATAAMVFTRMAGDADQDTLLDVNNRGGEMVDLVQGEEGLGRTRERECREKIIAGRHWAKRRPVRLMAESLRSISCA